ncbi:MAG: hypothetical protein SFV17_18830 [Candidatus Obscuribacter sp.]|nr:hypothetical protein [Candidatus Obscuribacter sp.]
MYNLDFGCATGMASAPAVDEFCGRTRTGDLDGEQKFLQEVRRIICAGRVPTGETETAEESSTTCSSGVCAVTWKPVRK